MTVSWNAIMYVHDYLSNKSNKPMRWSENEWITKDLSKVIYALLPHVLYTKESHIIVIIPTKKDRNLLRTCLGCCESKDYNVSTLISNHNNPTNPWDEMRMNEKQKIWTKSFMLCFHIFVHKRITYLCYYSYSYNTFF